jgi:hypothetical protein
VMQFVFSYLDAAAGYPPGSIVAALARRYG